MKPARVLNVAAHLMLSQSTDAATYRRLQQELTGPLRTVGDRPIETNAPAWWHGDEEAYESSMAAMVRLPGRRR